MHDLRANEILYCMADEKYNENIYEEKGPMNTYEDKCQALAGQMNNFAGETLHEGTRHNIGSLRKSCNGFKIK